jgi:cysteinyl-tRNA synthetase
VVITVINIYRTAYNDRCSFKEIIMSQTSIAVSTLADAVNQALDVVDQALEANANDVAALEIQTQKVHDLTAQLQDATQDDAKTAKILIALTNKLKDLTQKAHTATLHT